MQLVQLAAGDVAEAGGEDGDEAASKDKMQNTDVGAKRARTECMELII